MRLLKIFPLRGMLYIIIKKLIIIPIFLISLAVTGTTYYVKNAGNDSNTGLSDEQAWAHHPWMSTWTGTVTLRPGDIVNMKKGDVWIITTPSAPYMTVNQSGSAGSPITTTWYGVSVNKPLIKIAGDYNYPVIQGLGKSFITFDHLEISHYTSTRKNSGQSGIVFGKDYSDSNVTPHDWIITNCDIHNIPMIGIQGYDDSYNIVIGDTSATTCATSSSYSNNIYDCGYGGIVLCGRDPVSDHSHWDIIYNYIHEIDYSGGQVRDAYGIAFDAGETGVGRGYSDGWPSYCVAKFNRVEDVPGHTGIDTHGGTNIYFQDNYVYNCLMGIVTQAADRLGHETTILSNVYVERNTIKNPSTNTLGYRCFILMVGENVLHRPTNCHIRDNILAYDSRPTSEIGAIGIEIYSVDGITIEGNKIYNGPIEPVGQSDAGIHIGETNRNVKNITICKNWIFNWDRGIYTCSGAVDGDITFYSNIINSQGRAFMAYGGAFSGNFKVYNNTILSASGTTYPYVIDFSGSEISTGASLSIKNNIVGFTTADSYGYYILTPGTIDGTVTIDYNLYWNSIKANPYYLQNVAHSWPDWNTHGYDAHSIYNNNPLFVNSSGLFSQDLDFELQSSSPVINKGTDVGLETDYSGNPIFGLPDIGAFETLPASNTPTPAFLGSVIENPTPSTVELTYDITLANIIPATSAFSVGVNSTARTISSVTISGTKVLLTLASTVAYGDVVTVAYTKPSTNPLQTSAGGQAATISAQAVTNKVAAPAAPVYSSGAIENAAPSKLEMTYDLTLVNIVPAASAFTVNVNSLVRTINSVAISGPKVMLTLASPVAYGDVVTVAYTKPSSNPLQTPAGGKASSLTAQTVTNKVASPAVPVYVSSAIENATPSRLEMTYNFSLANIIPVASAFTVNVNSTARAVSSIAISDIKVLLTLASPVAYGNVVTVSYSKPSVNPLQTTAGGQAASISAQTVTNRVEVVNIKPVVIVTFPSSSYSGFVNEISASGSYDANKDDLTYIWSAPVSVPLSATTNATIKFLGPIVTEPTTVEFTVGVSDGKTSQSKTVPVEIQPYKPELEVAEVLSVETSSYNSMDYPRNIIDGNISTMWSANGIDQWLILELKELFSVHHVKLAFQPGQKMGSYFDILGSDDKESWEPILIKSASCGFSGDLQVFDFPPSKTGKEFKYVKLVGLGNSVNTWNYISELKVYGYRHPNPSFYENLSVKLYPNPAREIIKIRIDEPSLALDFIRIINPLGKVAFENNLDPAIREFQIPIYLQNGVYIVQLGSGELTLFTQKLIVASK